MAKPERILAHELLDHEVMDLSAGQILGTVVDFAISRDGRVAQLGILPLEWFHGGKGIAPEHITNINADRVCISSAEALGEFGPDGVETFSALLGGRFLGKPVLQHDGEVLGELADFWLSLTDGRICDLVVVGPDEKRIKVPVEAIKTIGRDYIVIERASTAVEPAAEPAQPALGKAEAAGEASPALAAEPVPAAKPAAPKPEPAPAALMEAPVASVEVPPELEVAPPPAPATEPSRSEEKQALFGAKKGEAGLSKFDQKKCDFLRGRPAHREIKNAAGDLLAAKGDKLDDEALLRIIEAGLLADVFIEMTVNK